MDQQTLHRLLEAVQAGHLPVDEALARLQTPQTAALAPSNSDGNGAAVHSGAELEFANLDHGRTRRTGVPEVIFCQGKTTEQIVQIAGRLLAHEGRVLGTRVCDAAIEAVIRAYPQTVYSQLARLFTIHDGRPLPAADDDLPYVAVATGGTSDLPVSEEAALTLEFLGDRVERVYDVGVAGIHRLLSKQDVLRRAGVVIAVAGMEGALPSVVAGLVDCPVVATPTSVGYGASFGGLAALLTMLNSCAPGVGVVNIDNGFGAAVLAHQILRSARR
jgi:pyridinium-3,5-biscarboxylic acid mononucleotide synthase